MNTPHVSVPRKGGHRFSEIPSTNINRSAFDLSHGLKTTYDVDRLIPVLSMEVLPGDTFNVQMTGLTRLLSPLKAPIMDNLYIESFFFFVPNRLVWTNWPKFCGEQTDPGDSTDYTVPVLQDGQTVALGTVSDYFGLPLGLSTTTHDVNALPLRGYYLTYDQWFRPQDLIDSHAVGIGDGDSNLGGGNPLKRAKRHDYFTACQPWPIKTDDGTEITTQFPVTGIGVEDSVYSTASVALYEAGTPGTRTFAPAKKIQTTGISGSVYIERDPDSTLNPGIFADITINQLRQAVMIQRLREKDARGGTRYIEILKNHFDVTSPDARLQRVEYLGGGRSMVNITPVAQTGETGTTPQANLTAVGTAGMNSHGFAKSFVEHGYILGIVNVRPDLTYQQGLHRSYSRSTRFDYYWPSLAGLGEQAVLKKEIYVDNSADDEEVFGYIPRWDEYRHGMSRVSGKFRSTATGTLELWHLAENFSTRPLLNQQFIEYSTEMARVQAVTTEPDFIGDYWFDIKAARPLPVFGVPGMSSHF